MPRSVTRIWANLNAPHAFDNLRRTVDMVNARHPDAVIVSGDVGENYDQWLLARGILKWLHAPVYYAPGNHDVHTNDVAKYREVFGPDYYRFQVKGVTFVVIDSQLLGNFDNFDAQSPQPLPPANQAEVAIKCFPGFRARAAGEAATAATVASLVELWPQIASRSAARMMTTMSPEQ